MIAIKEKESSKSGCVKMEGGVLLKCRQVL